MSISIYYQAQRRAPLNTAEIECVREIVARYSVDAKIGEYLRTGVGLNWESFQFEVNSKPGGLVRKGTVFEGATKLPDNTEEATWEGVQHWCACLSELRGKISGCDWSVRVDDHAIAWSVAMEAFDPST